MAQGGRRVLRDNAFLVAAVALPVIVVAFFLLASAVPRWLVPPPAYDLLLRAARPYDQGRPRVSVEFKVRDGRVEAVVRPVAAAAYPQPATLLLFEHETMNVREVPFDVPDLAESDPPRTIVVEALAGRQVLAQTQAPDGYVVEPRTHRGSGIVGDLFGMNRYDYGLALVNKGRVVPITLASTDHYYSPVSAVGWVVDGGGR
jgi:hypothetical protein